MQENRPRRSRRTPPKGGGSLPFVPVIIGVVIFGFVVGAGLSVVGKRGSDSSVVAVSTSTPQPADTYAEVTPAPQPTDRPEALQTATAAAASPRPSPSIAPSVVASAIATARATASARASVSVAQTAAPRSTPRVAAADASAPPAGTRAEEPAIRPSAVPASAATIEPPAAHTVEPKAASKAELATAPAALVTTVPTTPPVTSAVVDADSDFARLAGNVVRQYLLALARGDTTSAYAVLSPSPGSGGEAPPELGTLDSSLHIGRIEARGSDAAATVNVDLTTAAGPYYGQYTVHRSATGAAVIVSHTFGKP
jgi:hypothetical protein